MTPENGAVRENRVATLVNNIAVGKRQRHSSPHRTAVRIPLLHFGAYHNRAYIIEGLNCTYTYTLKFNVILYQIISECFVGNLENEHSKWRANLSMESREQKLRKM